MVSLGGTEGGTSETGELGESVILLSQNMSYLKLYFAAIQIPAIWISIIRNYRNKYEGL